MNRSWRLIISAVLISSSAWGASKKSLLEWDFKTDILAGAFFQTNNENIGNPGNTVLNSPTQSFDSEIRPYIKIESSSFNVWAVIKPKIRLQQTEYEILTEKAAQKLADYGFWEAYLRWEVIKNVEMAAGIINAQWGPSDLISPSQFMFPELMMRPEPFQMTQGLELAQIQWVPNQEITVTLMTELEPFQWEHKDSFPRTERTSQKRSLFRAEYSTESGAFALGFVVGQRETDKNRTQYGGYSFWNYSQEGQIYFDLSAQQGHGRLSINDAGTVERRFADDSSFFAIGLIGNRYTFSNGLEWKLEYIHNAFGLAEIDRLNTFDWIRSNPLNTAYLAVLHDTTSPFPGQSYLYNSLRWDNPPGLSALFSTSYFFIKDIYSITDGSQLLNIGVETSLTDSLSHSLAIIQALGDNEGELSSFLKSYYSYYLKYSF